MLDRLALSLVALSVFTAMAVGAADACTCRSPVAPSDEIRQSDIIFTGIVLGSWRESGRPQLAQDVESRTLTRFHVDIAYKGIEDFEIEVHHATNDSMCGLTFELGDHLLVFADEDPAGRAVTSICHMPHFADDAYTEPLARLARTADTID